MCTLWCMSRWQQHGRTGDWLVNVWEYEGVHIIAKSIETIIGKIRSTLPPLSFKVMNIIFSRHHRSWVASFMMKETSHLESIYVKQPPGQQGKKQWGINFFVALSIDQSWTPCRVAFIPFTIKYSLGLKWSSFKLLTSSFGSFLPEKSKHFSSFCSRK